MFIFGNNYKLKTVNIMSEFTQEAQSYNEGPFQPTKPDNNLVLAIVSTVLGVCSPCCIGLIIGIIAIVFSTQVDSKYTSGDYAGAASAAKNSRLLSFITLGLFAIGIIISIIQFATGGFEATINQYQEILDKLQQ